MLNLSSTNDRKRYQAQRSSAQGPMQPRFVLSVYWPALRIGCSTWPGRSGHHATLPTWNVCRVAAGHMEYSFKEPCTVPSLAKILGAEEGLRTLPFCRTERRICNGVLVSYSVKDGRARLTPLCLRINNIEARKMIIFICTQWLAPVLFLSSLLDLHPLLCQRHSISELLCGCCS